MVDLIELPYRQYGTSTSFDTTLPIYGDYSCLRSYGRQIELYPFMTGDVRKYKLVEQVDDGVYERTFLSPNLMSDEWWREQRHVYPVQLKHISFNNAIVGYSHKYAKGIATYLSDRQSDGRLYIPTMCSLDMNLAPAQLETFARVIPSHDVCTISHDWSQAKPIPYDEWLIDDVQIDQLYQKLRDAEITFKGIISLANIPWYKSSVYCYDNDPIDRSWCMYEFLSVLNDLVVTDLEITVQAVDPKFTVVTGSRYNINLDRDRLHEYARDLLYRATMEMIQEKFTSIHWSKIVITKTWAEEVYIDIYEPHNPDVVSVVWYIDLPIFSLGTVGLSAIGGLL